MGILEEEIRENRRGTTCKEKSWGVFSNDKIHLFSDSGIIGLKLDKCKEVF